MMLKKQGLLIIATATAVLGTQSSFAKADNPATQIELPSLSVINTTPLPGTGLPLAKYPGNVQVISSETLEQQESTDLSEALFKNIGSVDINSAQNNPFQNDLHYRGFLSSPLVGSAIGISTYVDGVRVNEGFGDTVNWDLIPEFAIANIAIIPGSNPLFGLNTLGGALSIQTKNGFNFAGTQVELLAGSDARRSGTIEHGGNSGNVDWYIGANKFREDGWRQRSPSDVKQLFAKVGWETDTSDLDLSYTYANNDLIGNGFVPESHLDVDRSAVYTFPDQTENELHFLNLRGSHWLTDSTLVAANAFYRSYERSTLNGDAELECNNEGVGAPAPLFEAKNAGDDPTLASTELKRVHVTNCENSYLDANNTVIGSISRTLYNSGIGHDAELEAEGEDRTTQTETDNWGGTFQVSHDHQLAGRANTFVVGAAYDKAQTDFTVSEAESGLFADGLARGTIPDEEAEIATDISTERKNWALFFTDTFDLTDKLALTLAGRYQHTTIEIKDQSGEEDKLNGKHTFSRFNPAIGLSYYTGSAFTVYSSYSESFRTPTAAELTCADPDDPCNLPNSFVADPPLDPVIGKTLEVGARGTFTSLGSIKWSAAIFRTQLEDDLLFTTVGTNGSGFFINVDETRRQGLELGLNGVANKLAWYTNYSFIDATFESSELLASVVDPNGTQVHAGDEIPAIPRHNVKLGVDYALTNNFNLGGSMNYSGSSYMRGDENNKLDKIDGYTVFNIIARYQPTNTIQLWAKVDNLFNKEYENSGIRNFNSFPANGGEIKEERFVSPGAPRSAWVGLKVQF